MLKVIYKLVKIGIIFFVYPVLAKEPQVTIVYSTTALQNSTVAQVISGIENITKHSTRLEVTADGVNVQALLDQTHPDKVIALGKRVVDAVYGTSYRNQTIAGLAYFRPTDYAGVSLALDNRVLVEHLSRFLPSVKRVYVVQQAHYQTIDYIPSELKTSSTVEIREGVDSLETIRILGLLLEEATANDAVFIPANLPTNILYEIAKVAWDKRVILLSTNLGHLEAGALIAAYPDDMALGEQLGRLVGRTGPVYESIRVIRFALNNRVAQHLAIDFNPDVLNAFTLKLK